MDFRWKEASPGLWERDADELEQFYATVAKLYAGTGRMFFAMTGHVSLTVKDSSRLSAESGAKRVEGALREAWIRIRYDYPTIAAVVEYDSISEKLKKRYSVLSDDVEQKKQDAWVKETFKIVKTGRNGLEFCNDDPPAPGYPTIFVILPNTSTLSVGGHYIRCDIVFRSPHDIVDGIGTLHLLQMLISYAAEAYNRGEPQASPKFGDEATKLSPCFREAAQIPTTLSPRLQTRLKEVMEAKAAPPPARVAGLPFKEGAVLPGRHQRVERKLSATITVQLLQACRENGATVTHAYHAAIAMSLRDLQNRPIKTEQVCYVNYILRNERSRCLEPYNTAKHAVSVYHSVSGEPLIIEMTLPAAEDKLPSVPDRRQEFLRILHEMRDFYHAVNNDADHLALVPHLLTSRDFTYPKEYAKPGKQPPVPPPAPSAAVSISSMGVIDRIVSPNGNEPFEVHDPWVTGEELRNGLGLFLGTFRNELCLSAAYNDAWHDEAEVRGYLERCESIVLQGFGLS